MGANPGDRGRIVHDTDLPSAIAARIVELEAELAALRRQQRRALVAVILIVVGPGVVFSARELWQHRAVSRELAAALDAAGIRSPRSLGRRLGQLCGSGLDRVGVDHDGALWTCST